MSGRGQGSLALAARQGRAVLEQLRGGPRAQSPEAVEALHAAQYPDGCPLECTPCLERLRARAATEAHAALVERLDGSGVSNVEPASEEIDGDHATLSDLAPITGEVREAMQALTTLALGVLGGPVHVGGPLDGLPTATAAELFGALAALEAATDRAAACIASCARSHPWAHETLARVGCDPRNAPRRGLDAVRLSLVHERWGARSLVAAVCDATGWAPPPGLPRLR